MICLGLDLGSSSIKGAVLDLDRQAIGAMVSRPFPSPLPGLPAGWFEIGPDAVETATRQVLEALRESAPTPAALFVSGQMGGLVLVDDAGRPLSNYLSWRDQRTRTPDAVTGREALGEIRHRWDDQLLSALGNELQPGSTSALLYWLLQHQALPRQAGFACLADYVIGRLCGRPPTMHVTHAIGLLDLATGDWHRTALAELGLSTLCWPELVADLRPQGHVLLGEAAIPVFGAYGDQQCALRGAHLQRGELSLNVSTGSQVSLRTSRYQPGRYQTRRYFDGDWLNTVTHLPAGRSLNVLLDLLTELAAAEGVTLRNPWEHVVRKAAVVTGSDLDVGLSFFAGPLGDRGQIGNISTENLTVGQLFHAAFRQMADNYAQCARWLDPTGAATTIVLSGGLTKSVPLLRKMIADRFSQPLRETEGEETLLGLLALARSALGAR